MPEPLKKELPDHDVHTVREMGWSGKKNGELIRLMEQAGFEVFLTVDQNLRYQQNLQAANIAVIVLVVSSNRLANLLLLMPSLLAALAVIQSGELVEITG